MDGGINTGLFCFCSEYSRVAGEHAVQFLGVEPAPIAGAGRRAHLALQKRLQSGSQGCGALTRVGQSILVQLFGCFTGHDSYLKVLSGLVARIGKDLLELVPDIVGKHLAVCA